MIEARTLRVLFAAAPGIGHVLPLVPLAWAMRAAGHEVALLTSGRGLTATAGLPVFDYAPGLGADEISARIVARFPASAPVRASRIRRLADAAERVRHIAGFGLDEAVRAAKAWRPDLVVHEPLGASGLVTAAALGIPAVQHLYGFPRGAGLSAALFSHLADDFARHGADGLPRSVTVLDVAPPSMLPEAPEGLPVRYVPAGGGTLPAWAGVRPRIVVTLGTEQSTVDTAALARRVVGAARRIDAEFVLALGGVGPGDLGPLPPNVRVEPWLPLAGLLARSSAVVHHGGAGTTMTALAAGVPQLVLPNGADRHASADAVAAHGAGLSAAPEDLDVELLAELMANPRLRARAGEVRDEIAAMPSPAAVVPRLVALAR